MRLSNLLFRSLLVSSFICLLSLLLPLRAEGVQQVAPSPDDMVMLLIGDPNYGTFATENSPESGRLFFQLASPEELLYIGLSQEYSESGRPRTPGTYTFQIKRASDGEIVHGPFVVNSFLANLQSWEDATGPAVLHGGQGYNTNDERYRFAPQAAGLYYLEFSGVEHIGYWDFTVGTTNQVFPGRVYSRNWAMRAPVRDNDAPECVWDREFDGMLYSYTDDGFVTRIDFADSGLQPLSFTLAFNTRGPGTSGDLGLDRMSLEAENATSGAAEHLVFLEEPDPMLFPDGECGQVDVAPFFECTGPNTYCLQVGVTQPGQVEIILDFDQDGAYDPGTDRRLIHRFAAGEPLMECLGWDGRLGDGSLVDPGARINLMVQYTQGVQHWALFDGEYLKEGFCVEPIRPICNEGALTNILYWDDRNIMSDPGTGQPKDARAGCSCGVANCRTWNTFSVNRACAEIDDNVTTGYGDKNTLNTWWFASVVALDLVGVPLIGLDVAGATEICADETTILSFSFTSTAEVESLTWTGPQGVLFSGPDAPLSIEVSSPGLYVLSLEDANGCIYTDDHQITSAICATDVEVDITVNDPTPEICDTVTFSIVLTNTGPEIATGIALTSTLSGGLENLHVVSPPAMIRDGALFWEGLSLNAGESLTISFRAKVIPAFDYTVAVEVTEMDQPDTDSTPDNGVDTDGDGACADDPGDEDDGDCVRLEPGACNITISTTNILCDPNGTPDDGSDDTFTFELTVSGTNGAENWIGTLAGAPISGTYEETQSYGPYPIAGGALEVVVTDAFFTSSCTASTSVGPPATCSNDCRLDIEQRNIQCQDSGTPFNGDDDTYTVEVRLSGVNTGAGWYAFGGAEGTYDEWVTIGPFLIADGNVTMNFVDSADPGCSVTADFTAPPSCSNRCRLLLEASTPLCFDGGTPTDPSDDTFSFSLTVSGDNISEGWQANDANATGGTYGTTVTMGPYAIADGDFELLISDTGDPSCQRSVAITAPSTCSDECALRIEQRNIQCQDNGTPFRGDDDTYTVEVRLSGDNTGTSWNAFGGFSGAYDEWVTIGPFLIAEGNVTMNFVDGEDAACTVTDEFTAPPSCSTDCRLEAVVETVLCNDNGTPSDPADDVFTFTLTVNGDNTATSWQADDPSATSGIYGTSIVMGPYLIADGDLNIVIADDGNAECTTSLSVAAPMTCSNRCVIDQIELVDDPQCLDNATPSMATDDRFRFDLRVTGRNTAASWTAEITQQGQVVGTRTGSYNEIVSFADFPISEGAVTVRITDDAQGLCSSMLVVEAPPSCSNTCAITEVLLSAPLCDDQDTPTDPSDDTYTFTVQVDGLNLGLGWNTTLGNGGAYGVPVSFGPFLIAEGDVSFTLSDVVSTDCQEVVTVEAPLTCSDECAISTSFTNVVCNDNGTPTNPDDDTYTFDLLVTSINATSGGWETSAGGSGTYGILSPQGPFMIADGVLDLLVRDNANDNCTSNVSVAPPPACSDDCRIDIEIISVDCADAGTADDTTDDVFTYTLLVTGENTGASWTADDGTSGVYGQIVTSTTHDYDEGTITVVVTDESGRCSNSFTLSPPSPTLTCPEDTAERPYNGMLQILRGSLDEDDEVFTEYPCFLAASSNPMTLGDRFFDALIIYTPEDVGNDTTDAIYSFYLFTDLPLPADASMEGSTRDGSGVLTRGDYQASNDPCCFSMSYDDATAGDDGLELSNPDLDTTGFFQQPMALVQKFKQTLKRGEQLTLTVSTFAGNNTGNYAWVIAAEISDTLRLEEQQTEVSSEVRREVLRTDLTYFDLPWAQNGIGSLDALGRPTVEPNCGVDSLYHHDLLEYDSNCEDAHIYRTFFLEYGDQVDSCTQTITFRRPDLSDVVLPPSTFTIECGDDYPVDNFGNPSPRYTGYPLVDTGTEYYELTEQTEFFNLEAFYKDSLSVSTQDSTQTWEREWSIVDYCGDTTHIFRQQIKLGDFAPPVLECPLSTHVCPILNEDIMLFGVDPFVCTGTVEVPEPDFRGFCEEARAVDWTISTELLRAVDTTLLDTIPTIGSRSVSNLEQGDYLVRYSATHHNGERVERYCRIRVADLQPPQAICETTVVVDLAEEATFRLDPTRVDRGSSDNCGEVDFALRRQYERDGACDPLAESYLTEWGSSVEFSCCDINQFVAVDFRVTDAGGNENGCALRIQVIDSSMPAVAGLEQQALNCQALPANFNPLDSLQRLVAFGQPALVNACAETLVEIEPQLSWNDCELGEVARRFMVKDALGNLFDSVYVQRNTVTPSAFYSIRFPQDLTTDCLEALPGLDWVGGGCSDFVVEVRDEVLVGTGDVCYQLARTYVLTDNCRYDGSSPASVLSRDENCNGQEGEEPLWLVSTDVMAFADADSDAANSLPAAGTLGAGCGANPAGYWRSLPNTGRWEYTQLIQVMDAVAPVVTYEPASVFCTMDASCTATVDIQLLIQEFCLPDAAEVRLLLDEGNDGTVDGDLTNSSVLQGGWPSYQLVGDFPVGTHAFVLDATDGCGNSGEERIVFTVADCYVEPADCSTGLEVVLEVLDQPRDLDGDGIEDEAAAILPASLLAESAGMDCSGAYSYSVNAPGAPLDFDQHELILTCEDRYQATVEVVIRDAAFNPTRVQPDGSVGGANYRSCLVEISVQDPAERCRTCLENELEIAGGVYTPAGEPIGGTRVELLQSDELFRADLTALDGKYEFTDLPFGRNYLVRPSRMSDVANGLSLLDMIILQNHLSGSVPITDPHLLLAADLDASGTVTTLDYQLMREILLGRVLAFPNNTSWRFFPSDYNLTDIAADIPDFRPYFLLNSCQFGQDFTGVKVGDLNGSAETVFGRPRVPEQASSRTSIPIFLPSQSLQRGDVARIPLRMRDLDQLRGLELNLLLANDQLRLLEVEPGLLGKDDIALPQLGSGWLKAIWTDGNGLAASAETVLFTLVVAAQADTELARSVRLSAQPAAPALAYGLDLQRYPLQLVFDQAKVSDLLLLANYPDPFRRTTTVGFMLPEAGTYTLVVQDLAGRTLFRQTNSAPAGAQQVLLDGTHWPSGVLHCSLIVGQQRLSRRIVKIN